GGGPAVRAPSALANFPLPPSAVRAAGDPLPQPSRDTRVALKNRDLPPPPPAEIHQRYKLVPAFNSPSPNASGLVTTIYTYIGGGDFAYSAHTNLLGKGLMPNTTHTLCGVWGGTVALS